MDRTCFCKPIHNLHSRFTRRSNRRFLYVLDKKPNVSASHYWGLTMRVW